MKLDFVYLTSSLNVFETFLIILGQDSIDLDASDWLLGPNLSPLYENLRGLEWTLRNLLISLNTWIASENIYHDLSSFISYALALSFRPDVYIYLPIYQWESCWVVQFVCRLSESHLHEIGHIVPIPGISSYFPMHNKIIECDIDTWIREDTKATFAGTLGASVRTAEASRGSQGLRGSSRVGAIHMEQYRLRVALPTAHSRFESVSSLVGLISLIVIMFVSSQPATLDLQIQRLANSILSPFIPLSLSLTLFLTRLTELQDLRSLRCGFTSTAFIR